MAKKLDTPMINKWEAIQNRILDALEKDVVPWRQTWGGQMPMNYLSKKPYRGINVLLLWGGESPYYLTWNQVMKLKGQVKPEEAKNYQYVYWYGKGQAVDEETQKVKFFTQMKSYRVYNLAQTTIPLPEKHENPKLRTAESIVDGYEDGPNITICACNPCYSPMLDVVNIPGIDDFESSAEYYGTLFHELVHSTGHKERLDRFKHGYFGDKNYSEEELVAEIGACYLRTLCGIDPDNADVNDNSLAYIKHWHSRLKSDPPIIKRSILAANKAVKRIAGNVYDDAGE